MPKFEDLTGKQFGRLTVLERAEDYISPKGSHCTQWKCQCSCGNITIVGTSNLKKGDTLSCGCIRQEYQNLPTKDISGNKYGLLTVISYAGNSSWLCQCECGNKKIIKTDKLKSGHTKSCGCLNHKPTTTIDLTGKQFGSWTVLRQEETNNHGNHAKWICKCKCGTITSVDSGSLRNGASQMCVKCYNEIRGEKLVQDITGKRYGKLVALEIDHRDKNETYWKCKCDCGKIHIVTIHALNASNTRSCGCWHRSKYEDWVISILENENIRYTPQIKFNELTGIGNNPLSYDFAIYTNNDKNIKCLIECQGQQHYKPINIFGGEKQFEIQQFHDDLKREYAKSKGITMIEISYKLNTFEKVKKYLMEELKNAGII